MQAAVDEATDALSAAEHRAQRAQFALQQAQSERAAATERVEAALDRLHDSDARMNAVAEQLGQLGSAVRAAAAEADRLRATREQVSTRLEADRVELVELSERFEAASGVEGDGEEEVSTDERDRLAEVARGFGGTETEARLALRTTEERSRALAGRADALERQAAEELAARERAAARRARRAEQLRVAATVREGAAKALAAWESSHAQAARLREAAEAARATFDEQVGAARRAVESLKTEQQRLGDTRHADEVARAQQRWKIDQLRQRALEELGPTPTSSSRSTARTSSSRRPRPRPATPNRRRRRSRARTSAPSRTSGARSAERALAQLGQVNPLALEEYAAMEERHQFLVTQSDDLKNSRKDLLDIVKEVDERVERVFSEAFAEVAQQYEEVFRACSRRGGAPGPDEPVRHAHHGIEVEARPAGKKVKRLSLLSGGERSLAAVAMLVSIFRARPSPFYVMDEVEAALDDSNLSRLITLFEELRATSQLIIITHQKRTMQIADALYGVTMRGDGISTVVSQRLREGERDGLGEGSRTRPRAGLRARAGVTPVASVTP